MAKQLARGRRPGRTNARQAIAVAASTCFSRTGFHGTTMRDIAMTAKVDPALIHHYFESKQKLFDATLALPDAGDAAMIAALRSTHPGEALVVAFLAAWDDAKGESSFARLVRTAATEPAAQTRVAELIGASLIAPALSSVAKEAAMPRLRASLVAAQLTGLAWLRYVLRVEPIASASPQLLAKTFGPSLGETLRHSHG